MIKIYIFLNDESGTVSVYLFFLNLRGLCPATQRISAALGIHEITQKYRLLKVSNSVEDNTRPHTSVQSKRDGGEERVKSKIA